MGGCFITITKNVSEYLLDGSKRLISPHQEENPGTNVSPTYSFPNGNKIVYGNDCEKSTFKIPTESNTTTIIDFKTGDKIDLTNFGEMGINLPNDLKFEEVNEKVNEEDTEKNTYEEGVIKIETRNYETNNTVNTKLSLPNEQFLILQKTNLKNFENALEGNNVIFGDSGLHASLNDLDYTEDSEFCPFVNLEVSTFRKELKAIIKKPDKEIEGEFFFLATDDEEFLKIENNGENIEISGEKGKVIKYLKETTLIPQENSSKKIVIEYSITDGYQTVGTNYFQSNSTTPLYTVTEPLTLKGIPVNDSPEAEDIDIEVKENLEGEEYEGNSIDILELGNANDIDNSQEDLKPHSLNGQIIGNEEVQEIQTDNGTLEVYNGENGKKKVKYTPNKGAQDKDSFTYTIKDGNGGISEPKTVEINIITYPSLKKPIPPTLLGPNQTDFKLKLRENFKNKEEGDLKCLYSTNPFAYNDPEYEEFSEELNEEYGEYGNIQGFENCTIIGNNITEAGILPTIGVKAKNLKGLISPETGQIKIVKLSNPELKKGNGIVTGSGIVTSALIITGVTGVVVAGLVVAIGGGIYVYKKRKGISKWCSNTLKKCCPWFFRGNPENNIEELERVVVEREFNKPEPEPVKYKEQPSPSINNDKGLNENKNYDQFNDVENLHTEEKREVETEEIEIEKKDIVKKGASYEKPPINPFTGKPFLTAEEFNKQLEENWKGKERGEEKYFETKYLARQKEITKMCLQGYKQS